MQLPAHKCNFLTFLLQQKLALVMRQELIFTAAYAKVYVWRWGLRSWEIKGAKHSVKRFRRKSIFYWWTKTSVASCNRIKNKAYTSEEPKQGSKIASRVFF